jgi:oxalate decarboxylase/phosphoglucose isomerase-like protein (cupin superfamily)
MKVTSADGKVSTWEAKAGEQAWMEAEVAHTSENTGKTTIQYVLVEVKSARK